MTAFRADCAWQAMQLTMPVELLKQNVMDSILESFKRLSEGVVIDYVRIGIICYVTLSMIFLYAFLN